MTHGNQASQLRHRPRRYPIVTLAEAVTYIVTGKFKNSTVLMRVYRQGGYKFSSSTKQRFNLVAGELILFAARGQLEILGQRQDAAGADLLSQGRVPADFFQGSVACDVMRDLIEPDCEIGDNWLAPYPRYRHVRVNLDEFLKLRERSGRAAVAKRKGPPSQGRVNAWMLQRFKQWPAEALFPTQKEDLLAAKSLGDVRKAQIEIARKQRGIDASWSKPGPRRSKQVPKQSSRKASSRTRDN